MTKNNKVKVAIVTGSASGIGRSTALAFAQTGVNVVIVDVFEVEGVKTAKMVEQEGVKALFVKCDVSSEADVKNLMKRAIEVFGRVDYAVNNAGTEGKPASTVECTNENWDRVIAVDLKGVWLCSEGASFVTGHPLVVDGGWTAQ